jgi:antitoxin HicB
VRSLRYTILLHPAPPEEGGYTVTVPALPGVVTEGDTLEEAIAMAREAIELHLEGLMADGVPIPEEDAPTQVLTLTVDVAA